jgi:hypothetical protein
MGLVPSRCKPPPFRESASSIAKMEKIKNIIKKNVIKKDSKSNTKVLIQQQISIVHGENYDRAVKLLDGPKYVYMCPIDSVLEGLRPQMYGCSYDVSQISDVKILKVDETLMKDTTNIMAKIDSEIQNTFPANGSDSQIGKSLKNPNIVEKIKTVFDSYKEENLIKDGVLKLVITKPIKCNNPCNGENANPLISDNIVLDKIVDEIYDKLPLNKRDIKYEDKESMSVGDKSMTPVQKKAHKIYCTSVAYINILFLFGCATVFCILISYIFKN